MDKNELIRRLEMLSQGLARHPIEADPEWRIDYDPIDIVWDAIDYVRGDDGDEMPEMRSE